MDNLGSALLCYPGFARFGFEIAAIFDSNPKKLGMVKHIVTQKQNFNSTGIGKGICWSWCRQGQTSD